jgi:hypothetical protein
VKKTDAIKELDAALKTIAVACELLRPYLPLFRQFEREKRLMESAGPVLDPTLFNSSERRATEAIVAPAFSAAQAFIAEIDAQQARVKAAFATVKREA